MQHGFFMDNTKIVILPYCSDIVPSDTQNNPSSQTSRSERKWMEILFTRRRKKTVYLCSFMGVWAQVQGSLDPNCWRKLDDLSYCCGRNARAKKNQLPPETELEEQQVMDGRLDFSHDNNTLFIDYCVAAIYINTHNENIRDVCITSSLFMASLFIIPHVILP